MTVCEYFGLPGSGKTTRMMATGAGADVRAYYVNGVSLQQDARKTSALGKMLNAVRGNPAALFFRTRRLAKKYRLDSTFKPFLRSTQALYLNMARWERADTDALVVNDNGFVQILVSLLKRMDAPDVPSFVFDYMDAFFRCSYPYRFVYLQTPAEECLNRIVRRGKALSITRQGTDTLRELHREKALFDEVEQALCRYFHNEERVSIEREENS